MVLFIILSSHHYHQIVLSTEIYFPSYSWSPLGQFCIFQTIRAKCLLLLVFLWKFPRHILCQSTCFFAVPTFYQVLFTILHGCTSQQHWHCKFMQFEHHLNSYLFFLKIITCTSAECQLQVLRHLVGDTESTNHVFQGINSLCNKYLYLGDFLTPVI